MRTAPALAAALLAALPAAAAEPPACPGPGAVALAGEAPRQRLAAEDGLVLARAGRRALALAAEAADVSLSRSLGVVLSFADGRECLVPLPADGLRMVEITPPSGRAAPVAIEAGLCDAQHLTCLPVRLEIPPRR